MDQWEPGASKTSPQHARNNTPECSFRPPPLLLPSAAQKNQRDRPPLSQTALDQTPLPSLPLARSRCWAPQHAPGLAPLCLQSRRSSYCTSGTTRCELGCYAGSLGGWRGLALGRTGWTRTGLFLPTEEWEPQTTARGVHGAPERELTQRTPISAAHLLRRPQRRATGTRSTAHGRTRTSRSSERTTATPSAQATVRRSRCQGWEKADAGSEKPVAANQNYTVTTQLDNGIRMLQVSRRTLSPTRSRTDDISAWRYKAT